MMNSVAPVWDGNETWLVLGGGGLFAAFPKAYAALMPAVYMPIGFMLTALIFRGVAFEFRFKASGSGRSAYGTRPFTGARSWRRFSQGLVLGAIVQGITLEDGRFAGGMFDWLTPFSFVVGCALVWGYHLLGSTWLVIKTEGELAGLVPSCRRHGRRHRVADDGHREFLGTYAGCRRRRPWGLSYPDVTGRQLAPLTPIPILVGVAFMQIVRGLRGGATYSPHIWAIVLFLLGFVGLLVGIYPYLVPYDLTFTQAAAAPNSQGLLLVGALVMLPIILAYTGYVYWIFRGKVAADAGYHH